MTKQNLEFNNEETKNDNSRFKENKSQLPVPLGETESEKKDTNIVELGMMNKKQKAEAKMKKNKNRLFCQCFSNFKNIKRYWSSIIVRLMFLGIPCFHIYLVSCIYSNSFFFFLFAYIIVILADGVYVLVKRHGNEHHW